LESIGYVPRRQPRLAILPETVRREGLDEVGQLQAANRGCVRPSDFLHGCDDPQLPFRLEPPDEQVQEHPGSDAALAPGHDRVELLFDGSERAAPDGGNGPIAQLSESLREAARRIHQQDVPRAFQREAPRQSGIFQSETSLCSRP